MDVFDRPIGQQQPMFNVDILPVAERAGLSFVARETI